MYNVYNELIMLLFLENCALLGYYAAWSGNFLPKFWYNLSVPSSRVNNLKGKPAVQIRSLFGKSVSGDIILSRITGIALLLDMQR